MRWRHERSPSDGERRTASWFAWLPYRVGLETRWLERVRVRQMYDADLPPFISGWVDLYFVDESEV